MTYVWQALVANFAVVALVTSIWSQMLGWLYDQSPMRRRAALGLLVGLGAAATIAMSVEVSPGVFFDLRSGLLTLGAFFGGPVVALIATVIAVAYRAFEGGAGVVVGTANLVAAALIGLGVRRLSAASGPNIRCILLLGVAMVALIWASIMLLPAEAQARALAGFALPTSVMSFLATITMGLTVLHAGVIARERSILHAALEQSPDFQYIKDTSSVFVAANRAVARHNGFNEPGELVGKSDFDLYPPERAQQLFEQEQVILQTGQASNDIEEVVKDAQGVEHNYRTSKAPLRDHENRIIGLAGVTVETTMFKQLEHELVESRDMLATALAEMSDGLAMFDANGFMLFCNDQYRDAFPLTAHLRRPGVHIRQILQAVVDTGEQVQLPVSGEKAWVDYTSNQLKQANVEEIELFNGRHLQLRNRPAPDGRSLVLVSDATELKVAERALIAANASLETLASVDDLTGLFNRRVFDETLARELSRSVRANSHLSLLMVDVDRFKAYNDTYGHQSGDRCLKTVAGSIKSSMRRFSDMASRYGGEEFAIILPETDEDGAYFMGDALRKAIRDEAIPHSASEKGVVTVSVGLAHYGPNSNSRAAAELIGRADEALYSAKAAGRDRVMGWTQVSPLH